MFYSRDIVMDLGLDDCLTCKFSENLACLYVYFTVVEVLLFDVTLQVFSQSCSNYFLLMFQEAFTTSQILYFSSTNSRSMDYRGCM